VAGIAVALAAASLALLGYLGGGIGGWQLSPVPRSGLGLSWLTVVRASLLAGASIAMLGRRQFGRLIFLAVLLPEALNLFINPGLAALAVLGVVGLLAWMVTHRQASAFFDNMPAVESPEVLLLNKVQGEQHTRVPSRKVLTGLALGAASVVLSTAVLTLDAALSAAAVPRGAFVAVLPIALLGLVLAVTAGFLWGVRRAMALAGPAIAGSGGVLVILGGLTPPSVRAEILSSILPAFALSAPQSADGTFFDPRIALLGFVLVAAGLMLLWCQAYLDRRAIHTHLST
jgi:hypothetical protein